MKNEEFLALALGAIALYMLMQTRQVKAGTVAANPSLALGQPTQAKITPTNIFSTSIPNAALPGQPGYGWQYFTDGTAIDPDGSYWQDGRIVWASGLSGFYG